MTHTCSSTQRLMHSSAAIAFVVLATGWLTACSGDNEARSQAMQSYQLASAAANAASAYYAQNGRLPPDLSSAGFKKPIPAMLSALAIDPTDGTIIVRFASPELSGKAMYLAPHVANNTVKWTCSVEGIPSSAIPEGCSN